MTELDHDESANLKLGLVLFVLFLVAILTVLALVGAGPAFHGVRHAGHPL